MIYLKMCVGIDVAQNNLVCSFGGINTTLNIRILSRRTFANSQSGFKALIKWVETMHNDQSPLIYVMEATGVYHQKVAHWLYVKDCEVAIVMPNKISNFMREENLKTITDTTSADAICQFGLQKKVELWRPSKPIFTLLRQLTRERDQIVNERTVIKNQIHALTAAAHIHQPSLKRLNERKKLLDSQDKSIKAEIHGLIESDPELKADVALIVTIPGVGELTAAIVLGETNGFELIRNKRQLSSYAGLDVSCKESGTSVKAKPRISKKGNKYLRKAMHLPALTAIRHCNRYSGTFSRLVSHSGIKMKAAVSVQRKLLELTYILYKTKNPFDPDYEMKKGQHTGVVAPSESSL